MEVSQTHPFCISGSVAAFGSGMTGLLDAVHLSTRRVEYVPSPVNVMRYLSMENSYSKLFLFIVYDIFLWESLRKTIFVIEFFM